MKKVFYDSDFKCHVTNPNGVFKEFQTDLFDGKCDTFVEGYRFVPSGCEWTRSDGVVFRGEMVAPWKPYKGLDNAQREYERQQINEYEKALAEIEAAVGV